MTTEEPGSRQQAWREVAARLRSHPGGVAAKTLTTPLALTLARDAYRTEACSPGCSPVPGVGP